MEPIGYTWRDSMKADATLAVGTKKDDGKPRMDLIPPEALMALGEVLGFGAQKYAARNWEKGMAWGRLYGAAMRHLTAWSAGEDEDPESGMPHLWHAMTNLSFLIAFEVRGDGTDDRTTYCRSEAGDGPELEVYSQTPHLGVVKEEDTDLGNWDDTKNDLRLKRTEFLNGYRHTQAFISTANPRAG